MLLAAATVVWVVLATAVTLLPQSRQYGPGLALLLLVPFMIVVLLIEAGPLAAFSATVSFLMILRMPLGVLTRRAAMWFMGEDP